MRLWRFDMPLVVGIIVVTTFVTSIVAAIGGRNGFPLAQWGVLDIDSVFHGQVWRLVTWQFFELEPIGLIFSCALIYWFGRDLCHAWGPRKFLAVYFGFTAVIGAIVCGIGLVWEEVHMRPYLGAWPIAEALTIAWATLYPDREILFMFVIRANGKILIALTIAGTALWAAFAGLSAMLPHFISEGLMLIYVGQARRWWLKLRLTRMQSQKKKYVNNVIRLDGEEDARKSDDDKPRYLN